MPTLTIDNQQISVAEGTTVLEAAEQLGIIVPHFCYHKALGAVGACRMCAVTVVEGSIKGLKMSCLIEAEDGMVVTTGDDKSVTFRSQVGEWLMINHPHDCPVCDEGGECQLQEMTIASGHDLRRYRGKKRTYQNQQLGPFIIQEMNRCIQCYRCVRTYQDYCGGRDFGVLGSRNRLFFGRFQDGALESDFSGNIVDACPTGVFTDKTFRFKTRYWDLQEAPSICPHCSLGCATIPGGRFRELQRVRSGINPQTNGHFICDRGRFGSGYVNHPDRPRQARSGERLVSVEDALRQLDVQARELIAAYGPESVLLVGSERASLESLWLLQKWAAALGCSAPLLSPHQRRVQTAQVASQDFAGKLASLEQVRNSDLLVLFGVDPLSEAPMLALAVRQAVRQGAQVLAYDPRPLELPCEIDHQALSPRQIFNLLGEQKNPEAIRLRELLQQARQPVLLAGGDLLGPAGLQLLERFAESLEERESPCRYFPVLGGPNSYGAALLSSTEQPDLQSQLESGKLRMLLCLECDPSLEAPDPERFAAGISQLDALAVIDYLPTPLGGLASLFLPSCPPVETDGSFINGSGLLQGFAPVLAPGLPISMVGQGSHPPREFRADTPGDEPRPAWQLLGQLLAWPEDLNVLRQRLAGEHPRLEGITSLLAGQPGIQIGPGGQASVGHHGYPEQPEGTLELVIGQARYGSDLLSRHSAKLAPRFAEPRLVLNPKTAEALGLQPGARVAVDCDAGSLPLPLVINECVAESCALVENLPQLVPGGPPGFCTLTLEVRDD